MGRARAKYHDLPKFCYTKSRADTDRFYYSYRRPDTKKMKTLGYDKDAAIDLANRLNDFFAIDETEPTQRLINLSRRRAIDRIKSGQHIDKDIKEFLPDLFPRSKAAIVKEKAAIQDWADSHNHSKVMKEPIRLQGSFDELKDSSWLKNLLQNARRGSKKRGIPFDLNINELALILKRSSGKCEVSGLKLFHDKCGHKRRPYAPSIDRIDSSKGYSFLNVRIVCVAVNLAMNEWGETVLMQVAAGIYKEQISDKYGN